MMPIVNAVATITANPAPIVFLDSCVLLDIVRAPLRNTADEVRVARQFLNSVRKLPRTVYLLIGPPTFTEWNDRIHEPMADCATAIQSCNAVAAVCGYLALPAVAALPAAALGLPDLLRQLSADLLAAAFSLDYHDDALRRAFDRVVASRLPAKKGGRGAQDAVILEHALEVTRQLRMVGFADTCVFTSSNTTDFAESKSTRLHPLLAPDFSPLNLLYATSLVHAEAHLLAAGWAP